MLNKLNIIILLLTIKTVTSNDYECLTMNNFNRVNLKKLNPENGNLYGNLTLEDRFLHGDFKGQGSFGKVHKIKYDGDFIAAKEIIIKRSGNFATELRMMKSEINHLEKLGTGDKKEYFPEFFGCTLDGQRGGPAKIMVLQETLETDFEKETTCRKFRNMYTPIERITKYRDLAMGLVKMHGLNLVHEDLKPENVMTDDENFSHFKIIDMGMVCTTSQDVIGGSPLFNAPEKISGETGRCNPKHDIWALALTITAIEGTFDYVFKGITAYCVKINFNSTCYNTLKRNVTGILNKVFGENNTFTKLVLNMINSDYSRRPTAQYIVNTIDGMTDKERGNDLMRSQVKHDFKVGNDAVIPDIHTLRRIEARDQTVNQRYQQRYEEREREIQEKNKIAEAHRKNFLELIRKNNEAEELRVKNRIEQINAQNAVHNTYGNNNYVKQNTYNPHVSVDPYPYNQQPTFHKQVTYQPMNHQKHYVRPVVHQTPIYQTPYVRPVVHQQPRRTFDNNFHGGFNPMTGQPNRYIII